MDANIPLWFVLMCLGIAVVFFIIAWVMFALED